MSRVPLFVANWKMNLTASEAGVFADVLKTAMQPYADDIGTRFDLALAPAYPSLDRLSQALHGSGIQLAAQNFHSASAGAFTGEVSVAMLADLGCHFALIGHSERRRDCGESDQVVRDKLQQLENSTLTAILCVGESLEEREADQTLEIVQNQINSALEGTRDGLRGRLVVAYEPVWAIGTGRTATPEAAQAVHVAIREALIARLGPVGGETRILYGGSVNPSNTRALVSQPDIDGALVGGASLDPNSFAGIALASLETA